jgi:hypothetical protein
MLQDGTRDIPGKANSLPKGFVGSLVIGMAGFIGVVPKNLAAELDTILVHARKECLKWNFFVGRLVRL